MIYRFAHRPYALRLRQPLRTAHGPWTERTGVLVRLEDEGGRVGFGEVAPIDFFNTETLRQVSGLCAQLGDRFSAETMNSVDFRFGCVRFALAAAVSALAPGRADAAEVAPAKGARAPLTALLPAGPGAVELLQARLDAGWLSFKWKVGVEPIDRELGLLDELLAVLPDHARLRLDANGAWDRRQATRWLQRCADRPIEFVEQPVAPADRAALFGLAADFPVKLALDESVVRLDEARRWQAEGWTGVFVIKPALAGPLDELSAWVEQTRADVVISSAIETALARAAIVHHALRHPALFARAPGLGIGEVFGDRRFDGPITGPVIDRSWAEQVNPAEIWEAMGRTET